MHTYPPGIQQNNSSPRANLQLQQLRQAGQQLCSSHIFGRPIPLPCLEEKNWDNQINSKQFSHQQLLKMSRKGFWIWYT